MPGPYNPGQPAIRAVMVNPTTNADVVPATSATDGSTRNTGVNGTSTATAANPVPTATYGAASLATNQVTVGTSATQIVPARAGRMAVTITMVGAGDIFVGGPAVTVANGALLLGTKGSSITIPTQAAVSGIGAVAQAVSVLETF